jgi:hypothetical protein
MIHNEAKNRVMNLLFLAKGSARILPSQNLQNWKKTFLANVEIAMEPSKAVKEYKEELVKSQKQNERLTTLVGKVTYKPLLLTPSNWHC